MYLRNKYPDHDDEFRTATVKEAELMRIPYIIVIGDKEEKKKTLAVRIRGDKKIKSVKLDSFVKELGKEIQERK